jgi:hypothetical protein
MITNANEWAALSALEISEVSKTYDVLKVGFVFVEIEECKKLGIVEPTAPKGKMPLPTITIKDGSSEVLLRLPAELAGWAYDSVALSQAGNKLFPSKVEFGVNKRGPYAEFVI